MKLATAFLVLVATAITAKTAAAEYAIIGSGTVSCGTWTADRVNPRGFDALQDEQWALGFLSGMGYVGENGDDPLKGLDAQAVWAWLDNYCHAHPLTQFVQAVTAFYWAHPH